MTTTTSTAAASNRLPFDWRGWLNSERLWTVALLLMVPFPVGKILGLFDKIEPMLVYVALAGLSMAGLRVFQYSLNNTFIVYLALQLITFFIFMETRYISKFLGAGLKLYVLVFGLATLIALIHLVKNFRYLWQNFFLFRCISIFVAISLIFLAIGHFSEFRLSSDLQSLNYAKAAAKGGADTSANGQREFGAFSAFVLHIEAMAALVPVIIGLMMSRDLVQRSHLSGAIVGLFRLITPIMSVYFALDLLSFLVGNSWSIIELVGSTNNELPFLIPLFQTLSMTSRYLFTYVEGGLSNRLRMLADFNVVFMVCVLVLGMEGSGGTSMVIGTFLAMATILAGMKLLGFDPPFFVYPPDEKTVAHRKRMPFRRDWVSPLMKGVVVALAALIIGGFTVVRVLEMKQNDSHSMGLRQNHWSMVVTAWVQRFSVSSLLFGNGMDSSREAVYYGSFTGGVEKGIQSPHNMYLGMGFDYGLVCLLYHAAVLGSLFTALQHIRNPQAAPLLRMVSVANAGFIASTGFMFMFLDSTVILRILYFSMLSLFEALKFSLLRQQQAVLQQVPSGRHSSGLPRMQPRLLSRASAKPPLSLPSPRRLLLSKSESSSQSSSESSSAPSGS